MQCLRQAELAQGLVLTARESFNGLEAGPVLKPGFTQRQIELFRRDFNVATKLHLRQLFVSREIDRCRVRGVMDPAAGMQRPGVSELYVTTVDREAGFIASIQGKH